MWSSLYSQPSLDPKYRPKLFNPTVLPAKNIVAIAESYYKQVFGQEPDLRLPLRGYLQAFDKFVEGMTYDECSRKDKDGRYLAAYDQQRKTCLTITIS